MFNLLKILLFEKSALRFLSGVVLSFAFSMAVILGTIGIMDGFDDAMKRAMKRVSGDFVIFNREGFFKLDDHLKAKFPQDASLAPFVKTEGFLIHNEKAKGVIIKGIEPASFSKVTGFKFNIKSQEIILGDELIKNLKLKMGDPVTIAFANGNENISSLPMLKNFKLAGNIHHGTYKEDTRFVYILLSDIQQIMGLSSAINYISLNIPSSALPPGDLGKDPANSDYLKFISDYRETLMEKLGFSFKVLPFWMQYQTLFEAVKMQKRMISIILQLIVIASIFNILAFVVYLNERRAQEIFLLEALGISKKKLLRLWSLMMLGLWMASSLVSVFMVTFFDYCLKHLAMLEMPGDIYYLSRFSLKLNLRDYLMVDFLALFWLFLLSLLVFYRLRNKTILSGLRKEFS